MFETIHEAQRTTYSGKSDLVTLLFLVLMMSTVYGQRRSCPFQRPDGCYAFGTILFQYNIESVERLVSVSQVFCRRRDAKQGRVGS